MTRDGVEKFQREDKIYLAKRKSLPDKIGYPHLWEIVDQFPLYAGIQTLAKSFAVFEIMKKCVNVPGHIFEFGCWNGSNLLLMSKILRLLQPNTYKYVYGFDSFEGLQTFSESDGEVDDKGGMYAGNYQRLKDMIDFFEMDEWVHIVQGNALETIPKFEKENPHILISLAYIDFDLFEPCKAALNFVGKRLALGGIIVFDEDLMNLWPGEGKALIEFLNENASTDFEMHNVNFARQPTVYLIKK